MQTKPRFRNRIPLRRYKFVGYNAILHMDIIEIVSYHSVNQTEVMSAVLFHLELTVTVTMVYNINKVTARHSSQLVSRVRLVSC